ncbi:hypothetical protein D5F01_LYC23752 [Larimichthys crocea]|uniref:Uncharacterized protein n=1 Tax=Larimichthys crocea TaxID=215358 RepID=A0A6G0HG33_LARCR|nr:hypothetical protein D5F01_LYC23752 [Larimichthys crocea]
MEHKTVRKFGTAQLYLEAEEYGWFRTWLCLHSRAIPTNPFFFSSLCRGEAKDLVRYFRMAWAEMGLKGAQSIMDVRTTVSICRFGQGPDRDDTGRVSPGGWIQSRLGGVGDNRSGSQGLESRAEQATIYREITKSQHRKNHQNISVGLMHSTNGSVATTWQRGSGRAEYK